MKSIHKVFIKGMNWTMKGLMSLLGYGDCTCENATEEYGVPHTNFSLKNNAQELEAEPEYDYEGFDIQVEPPTFQYY